MRGSGGAGDSCLLWVRSTCGCDITPPREIQSDEEAGNVRLIATAPELADMLLRLLGDENPGGLPQDEIKALLSKAGVL